MLTEVGTEYLDRLGRLHEKAVEGTDDSCPAGIFATRKVVSRDENRRFMLTDKVESANARLAVQKFGKIETMQQIGVFLSTLITTRSFRQAGVAVTQRRLLVLNSAIETLWENIRQRETTVFDTYNRLKVSVLDQFDALEQQSEYLEGMINLLNRPDIRRELDSDLRAPLVTDDEDPIQSNIRECQSYLLAREEMDQMEAARDLLESTLNDV